VLSPHTLAAAAQHATEGPLLEALGVACGTWLPTVGDKGRFHELAEAYQLPMPSTLLATGQVAVRQAAAHFAGPVVLKAVDGTSGKGVFFAADHSALEAVVQQLPEGQPVAVQQYIEGATAAVTFLAIKGQLKAWMATSKSLALSAGKGPTVAGYFLDDPAIGALCQQVVECSGLTGLTGFDFMYTNDRQIYMIDPHFGRCTSLAHLGLRCGVDFGAAVSEALRGDMTLRAPANCEQKFVKHPEWITLCAQGRLRELWRFAPHLGPSYFFSQRQDRLLAIRVGVQSAFSALRCWLGHCAKASVAKPVWPTSPQACLCVRAGACCKTKQASSEGPT
jgi:hypothetical protein